MAVTSITTEQLVLATRFTDEVIFTNKEHYNARGQNVASKMYNDILMGKIAEFGVYNYINQKPHECTEVDLNIYEKYKSYAPDLISGGHNIHVKSCYDHGDSWVFQKNDPLVLNPQPNDILFLCKHAKSNCIQICKIICAKYVKYSPLKKKELISKVCVYEKDL